MNRFLVPIIFLTALAGCKSVVIKPTEKGVIYHKTQGLDTTIVLDEGLHSIGLAKTITIYDVKTQKKEDNYSFVLADNSEVQIEYYFVFKPNEDYLPQLHRDKGSSYSEIFVMQRARKLVRDTMQHYRPSELTQQLAINMITKKVFNPKSWDYYITPLILQVNKIEFQEIVKAAIDCGLSKELESIKSDDVNIRYKAISSLLENGSETAIRIVLEHWSQEESQDIRSLIIEKLKN